jgi:hypothetical protein
MVTVLAAVVVVVVVVVVVAVVVVVVVVVAVAVVRLSTEGHRLCLICGINLEVIQPKGVRILQPHALVAAGNMLKRNSVAKKLNYCRKRWRMQSGAEPKLSKIKRSTKEF